ncbi:MAG TPA: ResB protein required for cytochrome c biosynthesis, partial [Isosphaeraceae bacterium]|nr:ResB protein required for cytochrome c biosynthesis [Isosphaeraceae bacterium]
MTAIFSMFDTVYQFLASLKLAVISLGTLAAVLAYATFFESWYGTAAVQEWIYKSKGFAILLAFLGANILCAALIRFPWKRRQIGFLITHTGLLILLAGSYLSVKRADEGQVG